VVNTCGIPSIVATCHGVIDGVASNADALSYSFHPRLKEQGTRDRPLLAVERATVALGSVRHLRSHHQTCRFAPVWRRDRPNEEKDPVEVGCLSRALALAERDTCENTKPMHIGQLPEFSCLLPS